MSMLRYYFLCLLLLLPATADNIDFLPPAVEQMIKKHRINKSRTGLYIQKTNGTIVASHQAHRPFNPASVAKVITAAAAVDTLGVNFNWQTTIAKSGKITNGVLDGDLYLIGGGNPYLTVDNFLYIVNQLRNHGIHDIRGQVIIDDSFFSLPPHNPAAFDGAPNKPYNVGGGGLIVNFKSQRVTFVPVGNKVHIYTDPPNTNFKIDNKVKLSTVRCRNWRRKIGERLSGDSEQVTLRLTGKYSRHCGKQSFYLSALNHPAHVAGVFGALWQRLGGTWSGQWQRAAAPKKIDVLVEHDSPPLPIILSAMNKFSNNVVARNVYLSLAAADAKPPYTMAAANSAMQRWLTEKGVPGIVLENGSGLSRTSRITPAQMTDILAVIWHHPYRAELISSLPVLGKDGTLRRRLKNKAAAGMGHLKTGSLDGVTTISGFVQNKSGEYFMVTLFGEKQSSGRLRRLQDDIISWIYNS